MEKILALLSEIKGFFTGASEKLDKVVASEERAKALAAELAETKQTVVNLTASLDKEKASCSETVSALEKAQSEVNAAGTKIKDLEAAVEKAKQTAAEVIASQGLAKDQLPPGSLTSTPAATGAVAPGMDPKLKGMARLVAHFGKK